MKKRIILALSFLFFAISVSAQRPTNSLDKIKDGKNAVGIKVGSGISASYQRYLSSYNRIETNLSLGFINYGFSADALYQWVWTLSRNAPGLNWYAGAGAGVGVYNSYFNASVLGQVGIEYTLKNVPLQFSIDVMPALSFGNREGYFGVENFGLGVRYRF